MRQNINPDVQSIEKDIMHFLIEHKVDFHYRTMILDCSMPVNFLFKPRSTMDYYKDCPSEYSDLVAVSIVKEPKTKGLYKAVKQANPEVL